MSINRQMLPYSLYVSEPIKDKYGHVNDDWKYVTEVMVAVNFINNQQITGDIRYKDCQYSGITKCKGFDLKKNYKLVPKWQESREYLVKSINELSRLTQFLLQAVI